MKKIYTILIMCAFLLAASKDTEAQIVKGEVFFGGNLSQVDADGTIGYKRFGLNGGVGAIVPIYRRGNLDIEFALEVALNQKGSHDAEVEFLFDSNGDGITDNYRYGKYDLRMNYLEVPMLIYFSDRQIYSIGIGASYGRMVGLKEYEGGERTDITLETGYENGGYKLDDYSLLLEGKIRLHERWKIGIRYQHSLFDIRKRYDLKTVMENLGLINTNLEPILTPSEIDQLNANQRPYQRNKCLSIRLIYVFNEERSSYIYDEYQFQGDNPKIHQKTIDKQLKKLKKQQEREARRGGKN